MSNSLNKAFRTTKIKVNNTKIFTPEAQAEIGALFSTLEAAKTDAVAAERIANIATARATAKRSNANIAELELLNAASSSSDQIAGEKLWIVYKDKEGFITFEGITERLMRNNFRAHQESVANQANNDDADRTGLYEANEEDEDETSS